MAEIYIRENFEAKPSEGTPRILIVEDEINIAMELQEAILSLEIDVCGIVGSAKEAVERAEKDKPDLILMDIDLQGDNDSVKAADLIRETLDIPVIFLTAFADRKLTERANTALPLGYLLKPAQENNLRVAINMALYSAKVDHERKLAENKIRAQDEWLRGTFDQAAVGIIHFNFNGRFLRVNQRFCELIGYKEEEILQTDFQHFNYPEDRIADEKLFKQIADGEIDKCKKEKRFIRQDGTALWVQISVSLIREITGKPYCLVGILEDITKRKIAEEKLNRESEVNALLAEISRELMSSAPDLHQIGHLILDRAKYITQSEHGYIGLIDQKNGDLVIFSLSQMMDVCNVAEDKKTTIFPMGEDGEYPHLWGYTLNKRKSLYTNNPEKHTSAIGAPPGHIPINQFLSVPVLIKGAPVGQISLANTAAGYTRGDVKTIEQIAELYALAIERERQEKENELLQAQIRQMQKMEAIGTLAGGIAHDFNNILQPIMGFADMALQNMPSTDINKRYLASILAASKRAKDLVRQILTFSRNSEHELQPVIIQSIIKEALKLIRHSLPTTIEIRQQIDNKCGMVIADPTKIHQIIMNLSTNAFHAMQENGGVLEVTLKPVELVTSNLKVSEINPGKYIRLSVSDTGSGMSPQILEKIFDPYFTTKEQGKGTGLGLSVVMGIVKSHNGIIHVTSEHGKGSKFSVYLPQLETVDTSHTVSHSNTSIVGAERILLVDDEAPIVELEKEMLEQLGYKVTDRTSSIEALKVFKTQPDSFDMVITDMTMPNMTGSEMAKEMLNIRCDLPIILCTGFSELINDEKAEAMGIKSLLMKPISQNKLALTIRNILDAK